MSVSFAPRFPAGVLDGQRARLFAVVIAVVLLAAVLTALSPLLGGVAVAACGLFILALRSPTSALNLLLLSIPVQDFGAKGELTLTNALFGLTLLGWLLYRAAGRPQRLPRSVIGPLFVVFVLSLALSLVVARDLAPGIAVLYQWAKSLLVFFMALDLLRTWRRVRWALVALMTAGGAEAALGLFQYVTKAGPASFNIGTDFSRAYGTFGRPNSYAGYLEMLWPPTIAACYLYWRDWRRAVTPRLGRFTLAVIATALTAVIGTAIVASLSRGAWLGMSAGLVVMALTASVQTRRATLAAMTMVGLIAVLGGSSLLPATIQSRFSSIVSNAAVPDVRTVYITPENFAVAERLAHWIAGLNMFASNRLLGVGVGNFNTRYAEFNVSPTFIVSRGHAHNYYIQVAAESGLVGLSAYVLLLGGIVATLVAAFRSPAGRNPATRALLVAAAGTVTAVSVHDIFEVLHVLSMGIQLSVVWALIVVAIRLTEHAPASPEVP